MVHRPMWVGTVRVWQRLPGSIVTWLPLVCPGPARADHVFGLPIWGFVASWVRMCCRD